MDFILLCRYGQLSDLTSMRTLLPSDARVSSYYISNL